MNRLRERCTCQVAIVWDLILRAGTTPHRRLIPARNETGPVGTVTHAFCVPCAPASARYWWINLTAIAPSPTAEATRLIEPARATGGEYPGHAGLEEERLPRTFLPVVRVKRGAVQRLPRQDEAAFVELDGPPEPAGVGLRADKDEESPRLQGPVCARAVVLDHDPVEAVFPKELPDLCVGEQLDVGGCS
jgi:hypothetical protein